VEKVDYDARLHAVYAAGRQMSPDALHARLPWWGHLASLGEPGRGLREA